jgi:hypothetical protein
MTEEPKTLKDLHFQKQTEAVCYGDCVPYEELKAEAVKDYKKWEKHPNGANVCAYIKWKNNLTEEDLK